ncbi:MAG: polysaccharide deacetylase family protein [Verrucomicrobiota bacterium]
MKSLQVYFLAGLVLLCGCRKELAVPESPVEEAEPEENLEVVAMEAPVVDLKVEEAEFIIDKSAKVSILGYHDFTDTGRPTQMRIRESKFRDQMQALKDSEIPVIPMSDYLAWRAEEKNIPERCVVITADDGWREFHTYALPILKEHGFPFTMYIYTDFLDNGGRTLSHQQVVDMIEAGGEIGCHSVSHELMTKRRSFPSDEAYDDWLREELQTSKKILEEKFNVPIRTFAYPFGGYNERVVELAKEAGFEAAVTVNGAKASFESEMFELPRYIVHGDTDLNWNGATSFSGGGPLAKFNNLLIAKKEGAEGDEKPDSPLVLHPEPDSSIGERTPEIRVDVSKLEGVLPDSLSLQVSGFGKVPAVWNADTATLAWKVSRPLRTRSCTVVFRMQRAGEPKPDVASWEFRIDRTPLYLRDPGLRAKAVGVASTTKAVPAASGEVAEVRKATPAE